MTPARRSLWVNWSLTLTALILAVAVALSSDAITSGERESRAGHLLTAFRSEQVRELSLRRAEDTITLVRASEAQPWLLQAPYAGVGEEASVDQLFRTLGFATWIRKVPSSDVNREAFGLNKPLTVIELKVGQVQYQLLLGAEAKSPAGAHYVEVSGAGVPNPGVYVVAGTTADEMQIKPEAFRVRQLVPYAGSQLTNIVLSRDSETYQLKQDEGLWRFDGAFQNARLDRFVLDRLLLQLSRLQANGFLELPEAERLQKAVSGERLRLALQTQNERTEYSIGAACPENPELRIVIRRSPGATAACAPAADLIQLTETPAGWVDRKVFQSRSDEVEEVKATEGEQTLEFARREGGFIMRSPSVGAIAAEVGNTRVEELTALSGKPVAPEAWTPALARGRVELQRGGLDDDQTQLESVHWGLSEGRVLVRRDNDGAVLELSADTERLFKPNALLIRSRELLQVPSDEIQSVTIARPAQQLEQVRPGIFELRVPAGYEPDGALAVELVGQLSSLTAERWIAESPLPAMGLEEPNQVVVDLRDGKRVTLLIGARTAGGGYFARLESEPGVFILGEPLVESLQTLLVDRSLFMIDPQELEDLRLETHTGQVAEFGRIGGALSLEHAEPPLAESSAQEILAALGVLRAEAAVGFGPVQKHHGFSEPLLEVRLGRLADSDSTAPDSQPRTTRWQVGAGDTYRGVSVYYARILGKDAIFALPRESVRRILSLL